MVYLKAGLICLGWLFVTPVFAADVKVAQAFIKVVGVEQNYENMMDIMLNQIQQGFSAGLQQSLPAGLPENKKAAAKQIFNKHFAQLVKEFRGFIDEVMPYETLEQQVYIPLYTQYFSDEELKTLTAFFSGEVGQRFIQLGPQLMTEAATMTEALFGQPLQEFMARAVRRNKEAAVTELKALSAE